MAVTSCITSPMTLSGHLKSKRFGGGLIDCKAVAFSVSRLRTDKFVPLAGTADQTAANLRAGADHADSVRS
jgi:hypothetical protein